MEHRSTPDPPPKIPEIPDSEAPREKLVYPNGRDMDETYRFLAENIRDVVFIQDMDLNLTYVSPSVTSLFGISVEEALQDKMENYLTPQSYERAMEDFKRYTALPRDGKDVEIPLREYEYLRRDGSTFWGELKLVFLYDSDGRPAGVQGVLRDIDERKKMREILLESESKFRTIFDLSPQAIALTEANTGRLREVNRKFCELTQFAREEVIGKTTTELKFYSDGDRERFMREMESHGELEGLEMDFKAKDGTILNTLMFSRIIELNKEEMILSIFSDITERKQLESLLRHAQKMEAVGTLAGGIAHDFNNILQGISGYSQILLLGKDRHDPEYDKIEAIERMTVRGSELTKRLLVYARKAESHPKPLNLNYEIVQVFKVLERTIPKMIHMELRLAEDLRVVNADPADLEQILMNLCVNARDAMPEGGRLVIETQNVRLNGEYCDTHPGARQGEYVQLTVSDTGCGMDKELMDHIFEPFFTTKETGKGTGLGLAMVYGIVKAHAGYITAHSHPGRGTIFRIYFPLSDSDRPERTVTREMEHQIPSGTETILVVDDDQAVLHSTSMMLEHFGYSTLLAESGEQALEIYANRRDEIDLVILDLGMPGMGGEQCMKQLLENHPHVKVLVASGYSTGVMDKDLLHSGTAGFIGKPYQIGVLMRKVREALG